MSVVLAFGFWMVAAPPTTCPPVGAACAVPRCMPLAASNANVTAAATGFCVGIADGRFVALARIDSVEVEGKLTVALRVIWTLCAVKCCGVAIRSRARTGAASLSTELFFYRNFCSWKYRRGLRSAGSEIGASERRHASEARTR